MAGPVPLIPLDELDPSQTLHGIEDIRKANPHRFEMELLDRIIYMDSASGRIAGVKEIDAEQFWARGHFPHKPIFPGVLMMETAGQMCAFYSAKNLNDELTMVFAAASNIRFRGMVVPGDTVILVGQLLSFRRSALRFRAQAFVDGNHVFEGEILGMLVET